jgi:hypothetical protein
LYVINKILDLNKDKDNYGKNSRGRYPEKKERCYSTYIFGLGSEVLEIKLVKIKVQDWNDDEIGLREAVFCSKLKENYVLRFL